MMSILYSVFSRKIKLMIYDFFTKRIDLAYKSNHGVADWTMQSIRTHIDDVTSLSHVQQFGLTLSHHCLIP